MIRISARDVSDISWLAGLALGAVAVCLVVFGMGIDLGRSDT